MMLLLLVGFASLQAQNNYGVGEGFDPENPGNPDAPAVTYTLQATASPKSGGSVSFESIELESGATVQMYAYNNRNYKFEKWVENGETVSTSSSFEYTMPARDVTLTAVFSFDPSNPGNPDSTAMKYNVTVVAEPKNGGSFNNSGYEVTQGDEAYLYAYPNSNYEFKGWQVGGRIVSTTSPYTFTPTGDVQVTGLFTFNPSNPSNPGRNSFNAETGELILDDFEPGNIMNAVDEVIGGSGNRGKITMVTVSGRMESYDFGIANYLTACTYFDFSRAFGCTSVPSYAFDGTGVTTVILPSCIESIGYGAFMDCQMLTELSLYGVTPPSLSSSVFNGVPDGLVVRVLSNAIPVYSEDENWNAFTLLPLTAEVRMLAVSLPAEAADGRYKDMSLELVNSASGQTQKYVISDRIEYTFYGLLKDSEFNVYLKNSIGSVLGVIEGVKVTDEDVKVAFETILEPKDVTLSVVTADGTDVTAQTKIEWTRADGTYLAQGDKVSGLTDGTELNYRVTLDRTLGMQYVEPGKHAFTVGDDNAVTLTLQPIKQVALGGVVKDENGQPMSGVTVAVTQQLNGKYSKAFSASTGSDGAFSLQVFGEPASISASYNDYITQTLSTDTLTADTNVGTITLREITGARITTNLTYTPSVAEGETAEVQSWYEDYANIEYSVYNKTAGKAVSQFSVQYPTIALIDETAPGDVLEITARSKTGAFTPVTVEATAIDENNNAEVTIPIVELGGISASFASTDNSAVVGLLYNANGQLVKKYNYATATLTISGLQDGDYTLVTMANSNLFSGLSMLNQYETAGLTAGADYVSNSVTVKSGSLATVSNDVIPVLDESKLYYTGDNTMASVNKTSIVAGNYLTLRGVIDFKQEFAGSVSDAKLVMDLPDNTTFVENSVMVGSNIASYSLDGSHLVIPLNGSTEQVRFCVIPELGGTYSPSLFTEFTINGQTMTQPIGSVNYEVKDLSISVPKTVAKTSVSISGTAKGNSQVTVYDNGVVIGTTTALANGNWSATCELNEPYNLSTHPIYAKVLTTDGLELQSETKEAFYDKNAIEAKTVTMTFYNGWLKENVDVVFDFTTNTTSSDSYMFYTATDITFIADLTNNDSTVVKGVDIYVFTDQDETRKLTASYDGKKDRWVAVSRFESNNLPVNLNVEIDAETDILIDRAEIDRDYENIENKEISYVSAIQAVGEFEENIDSITAKQENNNVEFDKLYEEIENISETENADNNTSNDLIAKYLTLSGVKTTSDELEATIPENVDDEYIDELLSHGESLLANDEDITSYVEHIDDVVGEWETILNQESLVSDSSLYTAANDTIIFEDGGIKKLLYKAPKNVVLEKISMNSENTITLLSTDSIPVHVYLSNDTILIIDEAEDSSYVVHNAQIANVLRARIAKRITGEDVVAALNEAAANIMRIIDVAKTCIEDLAKPIKEEIADIEKSILKYDDEIFDLTATSSAKAILAKDVQKQINAIENQIKSAGDFLRYEDLLEQKRNLVAKRDLLLMEIQTLDNKRGLLQKTAEALKRKNVLKVALLGEITDYWSFVQGLYQLLDFANKGISDWNKWNNFIKTIPVPCPDDEIDASNLINKSSENRNEAGRGYLGAAGVSLVASGVSGFCLFNPAFKGAKFILRALSGLLTDFISNTSKRIFKDTQAKSNSNYNMRKNEREKLKCNDDEEDPEPDDPDTPDNPNQPNSPNNNDNLDVPNPPFNPVSPIHDPSGYVYEAVSSNRLEGVTATCYYKETVEDMYGDLHENVVLWNAAEYAQENPLFTDENGMYRWDVPQGLWHVKCEKEGYQTTYSEWLPVPPPQLEVNIAMTQDRQPEVKAAVAYEDGLEVEFDKYMLPETMTAENIIATKDGVAVEGTVVMKNEEKAYGDNSQSYVSRVRFVPTTPFLTGDKVTLTVSRRVKSYAGIQMEGDYSQQFDIVKEVKEIAADSVVLVPYTGEKELRVSVLPFDAAVGKTLRAKSSSEMIAAVTPEAVLDENGQAVLRVSGELPGSAVITFTIDGIDATSSTTVKVAADYYDVVTPAPDASRISGTEVYNGTEITLTCDDEDAVIYYTTDGSCPCDEQARKEYTAPITVDADMTLKAVAVTEGKEESDVAEFVYKLKRTATAMKLQKGWNWLSHNLDEAVTPDALAGGATDAFVGSEGNVAVETSAASSYKAKIGEERSYTLEGVQINPDNVAINLKTGWNWIGFPIDQTMTVAEAMTEAVPDNYDCIVGQEGFAQYAGDAWQGTLDVMRPGQGYLYLSGSDKAFKYFNGIVSNAASIYQTAENDGGVWTSDVHAYPDVMCFVAGLYDGDVEAEEGKYIVGAFSGDECRGVGTYADGRLCVSVAGEDGDDIRFVAFDLDSEQTYNVDETFSFSQSVQGNFDLPVALHIGDVLSGINSVTSGGDLDANIVDGKLYVSFDGRIDGVSLVAANGVCVMKSGWNAGAGCLDVSMLSDGVYILIAHSEGKVYCRKVVKKP